MRETRSQRSLVVDSWSGNSFSVFSSSEAEDIGQIRYRAWLLRGGGQLQQCLGEMTRVGRVVLYGAVNGRSDTWKNDGAMGRQSISSS